MKRQEITIGVLALQGAFREHLQLLRTAADLLRAKSGDESTWAFVEVRTLEQLERCDALILPGGESTTIALLAARLGLLEPLRDFVKVHRKPTWGTCAGLILLSESANRTKKGGQDLIGGLDVRSNRNHFGRQVESFQADLDVSFLGDDESRPFKAVFIRAPVVEKVLPRKPGVQDEEAKKDGIVVAPSRDAKDDRTRHALESEVEVLARLPGHARALTNEAVDARSAGEEGDIIAVRQGNVFGTSFHPELTGDARIHVWWLEQVLAVVNTIE